MHYLYLVPGRRSPRWAKRTSARAAESLRQKRDQDWLAKALAEKTVKVIFMKLVNENKRNAAARAQSSIRSSAKKPDSSAASTTTTITMQAPAVNTTTTSSDDAKRDDSDEEEEEVAWLDEDELNTIE